MRCKWRMKSEGEEAGTVPGRTRAQQRRRKVKEKRCVSNKIEAPCRFWTPNRRDACPEI